jgi:hypothetical protein
VLITTRRSLRRIAARLGRWPRRIACLVCLLLAAASAVSSHSAPTAAADDARNSGAGLRAGQVAVPVAVDVRGTATSVRPGDRVGFVAGASVDGFAARPDDAVLVADHLRVLALENADSGLGSDATVTVVVATSRVNAVRIAGFNGRTMLLIADEFP